MQYLVLRHTLERVLKPKIPLNYCKFTDNRAAKEKNLWGYLCQNRSNHYIRSTTFGTIYRIFEVLRHALVKAGEFLILLRYGCHLLAVEVQVKVDSTEEGLRNTFRKTLFPACVFFCPGDLLRYYDREPMHIRFKGIRTPSATELIKSLVQFFLNPFDIDFDQCDEAKVCMKHFSKVFLE